MNHKMQFHQKFHHIGSLLTAFCAFGGLLPAYEHAFIAVLGDKFKSGSGTTDLFHIRFNAPASN
jgi:hypothetical protein